MSGKPCIFVTGIWKSGNHLAYSALNAMGIEGPFNGIAAHLVFGKHRWAKRLTRSPRGSGDAIQVGLETEAKVSRRYIAKQAQRLSGKIMGGHAAYSPALAQTLRDEGARMICIRRDPRDILVSFADWIGGRPDYFLHPYFADLDREGRVRKLLDGADLGIGRLHSFVDVLALAEGWLHEQDVAQVSFEELIGPSGGGTLAAQKKSVELLHTHAAPRMPLDKVDIEAIYGGTLTFNKGRSQRWKELADPALVNEISERLAPHLPVWGYGE